MANEKIKQNYKDIANAIRAKTGENGLISAEEMPEKIANIETGIEPEGTKEIRANGEYNIREFENVNVDVPGATTKELFEAIENGRFDIAEYAYVDVNVPNPSTGTLNITANGDYNVTEKATAHVNVPNPSTGTLSITENNTYDVTNYASAEVNVEGFVPTGTISITSNGNGIDVSQYANADVNVPNPSTGTKNITSNGTYNVTNYASAKVNVPGPSGTKIVHNAGTVNVAEVANALVDEYILEAGADLSHNENQENLERFFESSITTIPRLNATGIQSIPSPIYWDGYVYSTDENVFKVRIRENPQQAVSTYSFIMYVDSDCNVHLNSQYVTPSVAGHLLVVLGAACRVDRNHNFNVRLSLSDGVLVGYDEQLDPYDAKSALISYFENNGIVSFVICDATGQTIIKFSPLNYPTFETFANDYACFYAFTPLSPSSSSSSNSSGELVSGYEE